MENKLTLTRVYPYSKGARIWVQWGTKSGKQLAVVIEDCGYKYAFRRAKYDYVRVSKYLAQSKRWTKVVRVPRHLILGKES